MSKVACARCLKEIEYETGNKIRWYTMCDDCFNAIIDPLVYQAAVELSARAGDVIRDDMRKSGMTEPQIKDVFDKAFAWLHVDELQDKGEKK